ncbi:MAG: hypothetical protein AAB346_00370, partial [Pseudomonadota bacterium]
VANARMGFSLTHVRQGKLAIEARPNANRRKMILTWAEADKWPQEIPHPRLRPTPLHLKAAYGAVIGA